MATEPQDHPLDPMLAEAIASLRDRDPERDLWQGIAPQLARRRPGMIQLRWPTALAAGLALVAGSAAVTSWLMDTAIDSGAEATAAPTAARTLETGTPQSVTVAFNGADLALEAAIAELTTAIAAVLPTLDPATQHELIRSMDALQQAVTDATARLHGAPDDVRAAQYLTSTLRRQHDVLRTIAVAASRS